MFIDGQGEVFMKAEIGRKIRQAEGFSAFVPYAFPPKGLLNWPTDLIMKTDRTSHLMGKLDLFFSFFCHGHSPGLYKYCQTNQKLKRQGYGSNSIPWQERIRKQCPGAVLFIQPTFGHCWQGHGVDRLYKSWSTKSD